MPEMLVVEKTPEARSHRKTAHAVAEGGGAVLMYAGIIFTDGIPALIIGAAGGASGGYFAYEEFDELAWLKAHGGSLTSKEALRLWLGGVTNVLGVIPVLGSLPRNLLQLREEAQLYRAAKAWRAMSPAGRAMANKLAKRGIRLISLPPQNAFINWPPFKSGPTRCIGRRTSRPRCRIRSDGALGVQTVVQGAEAYDDWRDLTPKQRWDFVFSVFQFAHSLKGFLPEREIDPDVKPAPLPKMQVKKIGKTGEKASPPTKAKKSETAERAPLPTARLIKGKTGKKSRSITPKAGPEPLVEEPPHTQPRVPAQTDVHWTGLNKDFVDAVHALLDPHDAVLIERELAHWAKAHGKPPELIEIMLEIIGIADRHGINRTCLSMN